MVLDVTGRDASPVDVTGVGGPLTDVAVGETNSVPLPFVGGDEGPALALGPGVVALPVSPGDAAENVVLLPSADVRVVDLLSSECGGAGIVAPEVAAVGDAVELHADARDDARSPYLLRSRGVVVAGVVAPTALLQSGMASARRDACSADSSVS